MENVQHLVLSTESILTTEIRAWGSSTSFQRNANGKEEAKEGRAADKNA